MFIFFLNKRLEVHHGVKFLRSVAQQGLEITNKSVDIPRHRDTLSSVVTLSAQISDYIQHHNLQSTRPAQHSLTGQKVAAKCSFKGGLRNVI